MESSKYSRRTFVKLVGVGAASLSLGGVLSACSDGGSTSSQGGGAAGGSGSAGSTDRVVVCMNTGSEPAAGFDPMFSWGCGEHVHEPLIQSTLITTDKDLNFVNDLATSYESSDDGMKWTFKVRNDAKFSDGTPLTAKDVAFTINALLSSEGAEVDLSMVDSAQAIDDSTVEFAMAKPYNALLYTLAVVGIVPEASYDAKSYGTNPIGSGRYVLKQWDKGQQVIFEANPDYYGEAPKMKEVVIVFMEEDASLAAAKSGEVDIAFTSSTFSNQTVAGYELFSCESVDSRGISLPTTAPGTMKSDGASEYPCGHAVTSDLAIRRALNYALDRNRLVEGVLNGYGTEAFSVCDGMPWGSDDMKVKTDVEKAKKTLADGGWSQGDDGVWKKGEVRAAFDLYYSSNDSVRQALAAGVAEQMKEVGIEISIKGAGWDDLYPREFSDPVLWGWGSNSPSELYELNHSEGWGNFANRNDAKTDAYLDGALAMPDIKDSYALWKDAQWDGTSGISPEGDASWLWLVNVDHLYFKKAALNIADQKPHPHGHGWSLVNNIDQWTWQ